MMRMLLPYMPMFNHNSQNIDITNYYGQRKGMERKTFL